MHSTGLNARTTHLILSIYILVYKVSPFLIELKMVLYTHFFSFAFSFSTTDAKNSWTASRVKSGSSLQKENLDNQKQNL